MNTPPRIPNLKHINEKDFMDKWSESQIDASVQLLNLFGLLRQLHLPRVGRRRMELIARRVINETSLPLRWCADDDLLGVSSCCPGWYIGCHDVRLSPLSLVCWCCRVNTLDPTETPEERLLHLVTKYSGMKCKSWGGMQEMTFLRDIGDGLCEVWVDGCSESSARMTSHCKADLDNEHTRHFWSQARGHRTTMTKAYILESTYRDQLLRKLYTFGHTP